MAEPAVNSASDDAAARARAAAREPATAVPDKPDKVKGKPEPTELPAAERTAPLPDANAAGRTDQGALRVPEKPPTPFSVRELSVLSNLDEPQRARFGAIRNQGSFAALPEDARNDVMRTIQRRPEILSALGQYTGTPEFARLPPDQQQQFYQLVVTGGLRAPSQGVRDPIARDPASIAVVFPGQRAVAGGGELSDTYRRAQQMRTLFPNARVDMVVFDPPQAIGERPFALVDRPRRAVDYIHTQLGWDQPWNYREQPVIERDGMRFIYATAPQEGAFRERFAVRTIDGITDRQGGLTFQHDQVPRGELPLRMMPSADSLGASYLRRADLTLMAGASHVDDLRSWHLDTDDSPRGRTNIVLHEPDIDFGETNPRSRVIDTTFSDRNTRLGDLTAADIERMRGLTTQYAEGSPERATLLRNMGIDTDTARRLAGTEWSTAYGHIDQGHDWTSLNMWREALTTRAAATGRPFTAFALLPGGDRGTTNGVARAYMEVFGLKDTPLPTAENPRVTARLADGSTVIISRAVPQDTYRALQAGSTQVSFLTGTNSFGDGLVAGQPFVYETRDFQSGKMDAYRRAAPEVLARAGFAPAEIDNFVKAVTAPPLVKGERPPDTDPHFNAVRELYKDPARVAAMFKAMSDHAAVDDSQRLRETLVTALNNTDNARARLVAEVMRTGDVRGLMQNPEFADWLKQNPNEAYREIARTGVAGVARGTLTGVFASFLGDRVAREAGLEGTPAMLTNLGVAMSAQTLVDSALNPTPGMTPRGLVTGAMTSFPKGMFAGGLTAEALRGMGLEPGSLAFNTGTIAGATFAQYGGNAAQAYLDLAGYTRGAGLLRFGGRAANALGVAMLADWAGGMAWNAASTDADFQRQIGTLAARFANPNAAPAIDVVSHFLPSTVGALGNTASDVNLERAKALLRTAAQGAEQQIYTRLAQTLAASNGGVGDTTYEDIQKTLFGEEGRHALDTMRMARGPNRTGFESALLGDLPKSGSREDIQRWVTQNLPRLAAARFEETPGTVMAATFNTKLQDLTPEQLATVRGAPDQRAALLRLRPDLQPLMDRAGLDAGYVSASVNYALATPEGSREYARNLLQQSVARMNLYAQLAERPGQLAPWALGPADERFSRMLVDHVASDGRPDAADGAVSDLMRRGGVRSFFANSSRLGEATVQRLARGVFDDGIPPNGVVDPDQGVRAAEVLGGIAAAYGADSPVARAVAGDLTRRFQGAMSLNSIASFVSTASASGDPAVLQGLLIAARQAQWGRNQIYGRDLRASVSMYLAGRGATWESLPQELRDLLG